MKLRAGFIYDGSHYWQESSVVTSNDVIRGKGGNDWIYGGGGNDSLYGDKGDDFLYGGSGDDKLYGGRGNDEMHGGSGNDIMRGGRGDDELSGWQGNDFLYGGKGADKLYGGSGNDTLTGGKGKDIFLFNAAQSNDHDTIKDFTRGEDKIGLRKLADKTFDFDDLTITNNAEGHAVVTGYGDDASITLEGVDASALTDADFDFLGG
ncbi:calcium-binding protein [Hoeflea sp.]|uniref:calcium-binding protein n=1 Tax=Hoeflea sp. TaxID=1940281 RepID=UPI003B01B169